MCGQEIVSTFDKGYNGDFTIWEENGAFPSQFYREKDVPLIPDWCLTETTDLGCVVAN